MGAPAALTQDSPGGLVRCEQGWFTSVRSPLGNGYRLIAASPGLSAAEKREIVACAPTHDSLCDQSANGHGLAAFLLASGRWCLFLSRHAGREPTARGGWRVETHVLVLDPAAYGAFGFDPLRVQTARDACPVDPANNRQSCVPPLNLPAGAASTATFESPVINVDSEIKRLAAATVGVLEGAPVITVIGNSDGALRLLLAATPAAARARLSISCGLRFTPARPFGLVLTDSLAPDRRRLAEEHGYLVIAGAGVPAASAFDPWVRLAEDCWRLGRVNELDELARQLKETCSAQALAQIAALWRDLRLAEKADVTVLRDIADRHDNAQPLSVAYTAIRERLRSLAASSAGEFDSTANERR